METDYYNQLSHNAAMQHDSTMSYLYERAELSKFEMLKPKISIEGTKYMVLLGDNIQEGIVGFGDTIMEAIADWNKQFYLPINLTI